MSFDWSAAPATRPAQPLHAREELRREVDAGILTTILVVLVGAPLGLLWAAVRPRSDLFLLVAEDAREQQHFSADLRFAGVVGVGGLLVGLVAYLAARSGGTGVAVGLAVGGLLAAVVAERIGIRAAHQDELSVALARAFAAHGYSLAGQRPQDLLSYLADTRFGLRAWPLIAALPAAAVAAFGALTWVRDRTSPRAHVPMDAPVPLPWGVSPGADVATPPPSRWG